MDRRRSTKLTIPPSSDSRPLQFITCDRQALSTARYSRAGQLATADTCKTSCLFRAYCHREAVDVEWNMLCPIRVGSIHVHKSVDFNMISLWCVYSENVRCKSFISDTRAVQMTKKLGRHSLDVGPADRVSTFFTLWTWTLTYDFYPLLFLVQCGRLCSDNLVNLRVHSKYSVSYRTGPQGQSLFNSTTFRCRSVYWDDFS